MASYDYIIMDTINIKHLWEKSWTYIKTVVDVVREPILILDKDLRIMTANESFYRTFQVEPGDTENKIVYALGNGQWDIPTLRKLLEDILPKNTFFKGFEVDHIFPFIGRKVMILNARQIFFKSESTAEQQKDELTNGLFPPIILLAIEDITDMVAVAETLADHTKKMEMGFIEREHKFETKVKRLEEEISKLKTK